MPMLPVNTAVQIMIGPLLDDTDKSRETGVAYNAAGMDIDLLKSSDTGTPTTTAIALTTAGVNDWVELSGGYYYLEITAAQNDTEGKLKIIGIATGIMAFESIEFDVVPTAVYDVMVSGASGAMANILATYDGTGYSDPQAPATQSQLDQIANVGAAINVSSSSNVLTTGSEAANTYAVTEALDGVTHDLADAAGTLDNYYQFNVGGDGVPVSMQWTGILQSSNDTVDLFAWDWVNSAWAQVGTIAGTNPATVQVVSGTMFTSYVGTGANLGLVRIRTYGTGLSSASLQTDQIFVAYSVVNRSVGYEDGAVWLDTNHGNTGTVNFVNGTADNASLTVADAIAIGLSMDLHIFKASPGSTITFNETHTQELWSGHGWTLDLNGQSVEQCHFFEAVVSGIALASTVMEFHGCSFGIASVQHANFTGCSFRDTVTFTAAGAYRMSQCESGVAGAGAAAFTKTLGQTITGEWRWWSGSLIMSNIEAGDVFTISGELGTITLNGADGHVEIRGTYKQIVDNRTGVKGISLEGAILGGDVADILEDTASLAPTGARTITATIKNALAAVVPGIVVDVFDSSNAVFITRYTDSDLNGIVAMNLDDGTYKLRISGNGFTADNNPETLIVTATAAVEYTGTTFEAPSAADPALCTVYGFATDSFGNTKDGETLTFTGRGNVGVDGNQITIDQGEVVTGPSVANPGWAAGYFEIDLVRGSSVQLTSLQLGISSHEFTVPDLASQLLTLLT